MGESRKGIAITLVILLGIFLQVLLAFGDEQDSPNKAVVEFAEAYFWVDGETMNDRLCDASKIVDDVDMTDRYVYLAEKKAKLLGYGLFYTKEKLYHVETYTISKDHEKAQIRLVAERKPPLQSFFTRRPAKKVDETINVIKEGNKWRVCGSPFSLHEG
ncbi:hypothetical protein [Desulfonema magnum]|uniref:DUF4878 domain-containing protein n=1 Tax=Desulfonema magnum TaxID=45655 RepID=A0A975BZN5_9BACT|nr:hypothetical protein [Desulfonema magnum]QTA93798.1 Uncharacterized protein dnm_099060 [Desulfonema magnum]